MNSWNLVSSYLHLVACFLSSSTASTIITLFEIFDLPCTCPHEVFHRHNSNFSNDEFNWTILIHIRYWDCWLGNNKPDDWKTNMMHEYYRMPPKGHHIELAIKGFCQHLHRKYLNPLVFFILVKNNKLDYSWSVFSTD